MSGEVRWDVWTAIHRKVESGGAGDDIQRDPANLQLFREFIDLFLKYLPEDHSRPRRVFAPGAVTEAVMLAKSGLETHAWIFGRDNRHYLEEERAKLDHPELLVIHEADAHRPDYPAGFFDGYFTVQFHEHLMAPPIHIGETRYAMRDGGIVFVDACGVTNPACECIWHTNLVPEITVRKQWEWWGFEEIWRGTQGDGRPQFVFRMLPIDDPKFANGGYLKHVFKKRAESP